MKNACERQWHTCAHLQSDGETVQEIICVYGTYTFACVPVVHLGILSHMLCVDVVYQSLNKPVKTHVGMPVVFAMGVFVTIYVELKALAVG